MKRRFEKYRYWMNVPAMLFLGMTFIVSGLGKLVYDSNSFSLAPFFGFLSPVPIETFYPMLPYIELVIGILLIHGVVVKFAATMAASLVAAFTASNIAMVSMGKGMELCGCFGMAGMLTYTGALVMDTIMAILVATIFVCHRGGYFNLTPWFLENGHKAEGATSSVASKAKTIC